MAFFYWSKLFSFFHPSLFSAPLQLFFVLFIIFFSSDVFILCSLFHFRFVYFLNFFFSFYTFSKLHCSFVYLSFFLYCYCCIIVSKSLFPSIFKGGDFLFIFTLTILLPSFCVTLRSRNQTNDKTESVKKQTQKTLLNIICSWRSIDLNYLTREVCWLHSSMAACIDVGKLIIKKLKQ